MWINCLCHAEYSHDSCLEPFNLVRRAKLLGLDGVCTHRTLLLWDIAIGCDAELLVLRRVEIST